MARKLPNWLQAHMQYMDYSEAPAHFNFWAGIAAIAGALRRKCYFEQLYYRWSPNFYIIFVAPSGVVTKSTAMSAAMNLLRDIPNIHFGPNSMTWQAILKDLKDAQEEIMMPDGMFEMQSCLTFAARELGSLIKTADADMLTTLTDLWDGEEHAWRKATATMGEDVAKNPWMNIIACTTPTWLANNIPRQALEEGFTSRCLFIYGDEKRRISTYPRYEAEQRGDIKKLEALRADLVSDLQTISNIAGEYELSPAAQEFGTAWHEELNSNPNNKLLSAGFGGYISRKQGHVHKVAMVIAAAYKSERTIELDDLQKAIEIVASLEPSMPKVFSFIKSDAVSQRVEELVKLLRLNGTMKRTDLYREMFHKLNMQKGEFDTIIDSMVHAGVARQTEDTLKFIPRSTEEKRDES